MAINKIGPNLWQIKISVRVPGQDYPAAKQEQFTGTKVEAEIRRAELITAIRKNAVAARSLTVSPNLKHFAGLIALFVEKRGPFSSSHSRKIALLNKEIGHVPLVSFADAFEQYLRVLKNTPPRNSTKIRSNASANRFVEIARAAFRLGVDLEILKINPITKARFPKGEEKPRDRYLNEVEELRLLSIIEQHRPYLLPFIQFSFIVPCRKMELVEAKREQYNQITNTVYIPTSKAKIPIHKPVPEHLKAYFRSIPADCPFLFYRQDKAGEYHSLGDFKRAWAYCLKMAGLSDYRVHDLRHRAVTGLIETGNTENIVADVCGWKSTAMLKNYRHINTLKSAQSVQF